MTTRSGPDNGSLRHALELVGLVVAPSAVLTGLLYYFAYIREQAVSSYFGIDLTTLSFSTQDYLTRSAGVAFLPLVVLLLGAAAALGIHVSITTWLHRTPVRPNRRWAVTISSGAGALVLIGTGVDGLVGRRNVTASPRVAAIALGLGALLINYTAYLHGAIRQQRQQRPLMSSRLVALRRGLVAALVLVAAFWGFAVEAQERGSALARSIAANLGSEPEAIVYSKLRLQIPSFFGVQSVELDKRGAGYLFRYSGLHLLVHSGNRWVLLPAKWSRTNGATAIVIPDDPGSVRFDFRP